MPRLEEGDAFPSIAVNSIDGPVELRERWRRGPLVVAFMRHFGWPFCREHLVQLDEALDEIRSAGGDVVCVFQYRAEPTRNFCRQRGVRLECLGDPDKEGYDAVGLERGGVKELASPKVALGALRAASKGQMPGIPEGDTALMPGTFVVDREGRVRFAHYNADQSDNPPMEPVLAAVRGA